MEYPSECADGTTLLGLNLPDIPSANTSRRRRRRLVTSNDLWYDALCGPLYFENRLVTSKNLPFPITAFCAETEDMVVINDQVSKTSLYPSQVTAAYKDTLLWYGSMHTYNILTNRYSVENTQAIAGYIVDSCTVVDPHKARMYFIGGRNKQDNSVTKGTQIYDMATFLFF